MHSICNTKVKEKSNWGVIVPTLYDATDFRVVRGGGSSKPLDTNEHVDHFDDMYIQAVTYCDRSVQSFAPQLVTLRSRQHLISPLLDYAKAIFSSNVPEYYAVLKCSTQLKQLDDCYLVPEHRCGSRLCAICNRIRSAKLVDRLLPFVDMAKNWSKVVLTRSQAHLKSANEFILNNDIDDYYKKLTTIRQRAKRKFKRDLDLIITLELQPSGYKWYRKGGVKSLQYGYFNPHWNIFGETEIVEFFKSEWIKINEKTNFPLLEINQKVRHLDNKDKVNAFDILTELLKYQTKGLTSVKGSNIFNLEALDIITTVMKNRRRVITSGVFLQQKNRLSIEKIDSGNMNELELVKNVYDDIPVKNNSFEYEGKTIMYELKNRPLIVWQYKIELNNYVYDDVLGRRYYLVDWNKIKEKERPKNTKYTPYVGRTILSKFLKTIQI